MEDVICTNGLTKRFGRHTAVNAVSLHVKRGEIYGFIGRNGAGKTTCMKILCGLSEASEGEVRLFGRSGAEVTECYGRIGNLIEAPGVYPNLSAYQNLKLKSLCMGIRGNSHFAEILSLVGLADVGKKKVKKYSLGMKQRLGIAMALIGEPDILILDEPINGLDPQGIAEIRDVLLRLNRQKHITILISSHILEELSKIADTYGIIHNGRLLLEISKKELEERCRSYLEIKTPAPDRVCVVLENMGITKYQVRDRETVLVFEQLETVSEINRQLAIGGCEIAGIRTVSEELEHWFLNLTQESETKGGVEHA